MNKTLKYITGIISILLIIWFSLDIQNLEKYNSTLKPETFNVNQYVANFWNDSLPIIIASSKSIVDLYAQLNINPQNAFDNYGKKLGISKTYYFMVKGKGVVDKVEDEFVLLTLDNKTKVKIATDFIYGNAVRDGSGKVDISNFVNMTDFNSVSIAINKLIKEKVVSPFRNNVKVLQQLAFTGAIEVNSEKMELPNVQIIPVSINYIDGKSE